MRDGRAIPHLALFDLDGTLTATTGVDDDAYVAAMLDVHGCTLDADWSRYRHFTDTGIAHEALSDHFARPPGDGEIARLRDRFHELLRQRLEEDPSRFVEVPGARRFLELLRDRGWHLTIATGGWRVTADLKRRAAGIPQSLPLASADDHRDRESIVRTAIARARKRHGVARYDRIVSFGDGVWDVATARALGLPFVGVARGDRAEQLRAAGARIVVADLLDGEGILAAMR